MLQNYFMIENKIIFPAQIEYIGTRKDKTLVVKLGTQELSPDVSSEIFRLHNTLCYILIKPEPVTKEDETVIDKLSELTLSDIPGKTQSQRLRNVLFLLWKKDNKGFKEFESYYQHLMERIIETYKYELNSIKLITTDESK